MINFKNLLIYAPVVGMGHSGGGGASVYKAISWKCTAVPNEGEVGTIYINNQLSVQQVLDIVIPIIKAEGTFIEEENVYFVNDMYIITDEEGNNGLYFNGGVDGTDNNNCFCYIGGFYYNDVTDEDFYIDYFEYDSYDVENCPGWYPNVTDFSFPFNSIAIPEIIYSEEEQYSFGQYNDQLSLLFSITPFEADEKETVMEISGEFDGASINAPNGTIDIESLLATKKLPLNIKTPLVTLYNTTNDQTEQLSGIYNGYIRKINQEGTFDFFEDLKEYHEIIVGVDVKIPPFPGKIEWQYTFSNNGLCYTIDDNYCYILSHFGDVVDPESGSVYLLPSDCQQEWKSVDNIVIQYGSKSLYKSLCADCTKLTTVIIPNSVQNLGAETFKNCTNLQKVILPNSIVRINQGVFSGCTSLSQITIPDSVKYIGFDAFSYCRNLSRITLPSSLAQIDVMAFDVCSALSHIDFKGTKAQWNAIAKGSSWNSNTGNYTIHCTDGDIAKS